VVDGEVVLDLAYDEDSRAEVDLNVVATGRGRFVEIQGTGEESTFSRPQLEALTTVTLEGVAELTRLQERALAEADPER
jgi:ribonuclease PH